MREYDFLTLYWLIESVEWAIHWRNYRFYQNYFDKGLMGNYILYRVSLETWDIGNLHVNIDKL